MVAAGMHRLGQRGKAIVGGARDLGLARRATGDGDEARAKALHAGIVLVARGLVDHALAAELGLQWQDGRAVGLRAAITAAFANGVVDEHALWRIGEFLFLATAALFGRADLVIDQYRHALDFAQLALHRIHVLAVVDADDGWQAGTVVIARQVFRHQRDSLHAFGGHLVRDLVHGQCAVDRLAAGHRDRIVVQDLVGHVDLRGDGRANRQITGVKIGAVTQVLEHMRHLRECRLPYPRRTLATHVRGQAVVFRINGGRHHMAADAGQRQAALGYLGRGIVRAARAIPGRARRCADCAIQHLLFGFEESQTCLDQVAGVEACNARRDHTRDLRDREIGLRRQQPIAARMAGPLAFLVELADHARSHVFAPVVQLLFELIFDDMTLFFDDEDFIEALRKFAQAFGFQRPHHRYLVQPDADVGRHRLIDSQFFQRFQHIEVGLAGSDDAQLGFRAVDGGVVQLVGTRIGHRCIDLVVLHQRFLLARLHAQRVGRQPCVQPAVRHHEIFRVGDLETERVGIDRCGGFDGISQRLEANGETGVARHRPCMQAEIQVFLHIARIEHRDHAGRKDVIRLVRQRR